MRLYFSLSHLSAGFIAVLVGFTSSAAILFQAASAVHASTAELASWILALGVGVSISCIGLSLYYRMPILTAWSTPGAALLASSLTGLTLSQAVGAFLFSAFLTVLAGVSGCFERFMSRIPSELASAMLAGILLHFGLNVFLALQNAHLMILIMLSAYILGKRFYPRYVLPIVLLLGITVAAFQGEIRMDLVHWGFSSPVFTWPEFSWFALCSVGLPLFVITMTSQNIPGLTVLRAAGFHPPVSKLVSIMGMGNLLMAPFGGFSLNLAAITAAICANEEADPIASRRYRATISAGLFYLLMGLFSTTIVALFAAFPSNLVLAVAGMALFGTLASNLKEALENDKQREAAILTFLVSASGLDFLGFSAAFWGLLTGILSSLIIKPGLVSQSVFSPVKEGAELLNE
ncbi:Inner membrane protein YdcO [Legionella birminghamensis]|uniref:inner membrane protein YdcO n=1 Tax=Legionella birminghamensis TaxID=28083 RepID=A0A378IEJ0_9GAMM|nr:benzoate/H(+) symporter BenE family transporter [Legionella birminghamensis]KTC68886.1 Inner membrane protein YdcO [Legionella birminghamensis]STX33172.1 Inner membrane protein ydcO [Legionella birminghamensis]